ncbi:MAG TPA: hypothetical protein VG457_07470 [Planctomycetota bacterium]|jgi:hypothetical protein|nr:hypothetical protein [Planctomycetota bacterium]
MPVRHCVFVADLAEMEKAFQLPLSVYVDEFLERPTPGDRLREYAELAFADEQQIQTLRKADRETMVMARRLMTPGQGPRAELPSHLNDVTGDYVKTRTTSQFKWLLHAFGASGRPWMREFVCSSGREWVEETLNLLFVQRGFSSTPEEGEEFRLTREALLKLTGPFPINEAGREVEDPTPVGEEAFPWLARQDGVINFRLVPSFSVPTVARTLATVDFSSQAFQDAGRTSGDRLRTLAKENSSKFRVALQLAFARPAVLAFIGS